MSRRGLKRWGGGRLSSGWVLGAALSLPAGEDPKMHLRRCVGAKGA